MNEKSGQRTRRSKSTPTKNVLDDNKGFGSPEKVRGNRFYKTSCGDVIVPDTGENPIHTQAHSSQGRGNVQHPCTSRDRKSESESAGQLDEELVDLVKSMTITPKSGNGGIPNSVLFYGWFFSSSVSASLKLIAHKYLTSCYNESQQFQRFLRNASAKANITDPLLYYSQPASKSSKASLYHVTAKFCGRKPYLIYAESVNPFIGKEFYLQIIGIFFTESTYGYRLKLSKSQEIMFDSERINLKPQKMSHSKTIKQNKDKNSKARYQLEEIESEYNGISLQRQDNNFNPSLSRAHITLGCAPGVKAVQTGLDLLDIIDLEKQKTCHNDVEIDGAILRIYGRGHGDAFVIYSNYKYIAKAVFMSVP